MVPNLKRPNSWIQGLILALCSALATIVFWQVTALLFVETPQPAPRPSQPPAAPAPIQNPVVQELKPLQQLAKASPEITVEKITKPEAKNVVWEDGSSMAAFSTLAEAPPQYRIKIHPTNYGNRVNKDLKGNPVRNQLLVVLHETTASASSAVHQMLTPHPRDEDQNSYHAVITLDGTILYTLDPLKRAYGAGNSLFKKEGVKINPKFKPSINNFAYHISLETPADGYNPKQSSHSGYTVAQYNALTWLINQTGVQSDRIVTHAKIDQAGERMDPRSFDSVLLGL
jgi:hypothetical protein